METDYTKSKTTFGGRKVNGLFRDKKFIRGYVAATPDEWIAQTWRANNGAHIVWNDTELALKPDESTFHDKFVPDHWISTDTPPPINEEYGESKEYLICHGNKWCGLATYNTEGEWRNTENRAVTFPTHYRELPEPPKNF